MLNSIFLQESKDKFQKIISRSQILKTLYVFKFKKLIPKKFSPYRYERNFLKEIDLIFLKELCLQILCLGKVRGDGYTEKIFNFPPKFQLF